MAPREVCSFVNMHMHNGVWAHQPPASMQVRNRRYTYDWEVRRWRNNLQKPRPNVFSSDAGHAAKSVLLLKQPRAGWRPGLATRVAQPVRHKERDRNLRLRARCDMKLPLRMGNDVDNHKCSVVVYPYEHLCSLVVTPYDQFCSLVVTPYKQCCSLVVTPYEHIRSLVVTPYKHFCSLVGTPYEQYW